MSITVVTTLHCEHEGCKETHKFTTLTNPHPTAAPREVRKAAKANGWSRTAGKDFCPEHKMVRKTVLVPAS